MEVTLSAWVCTSLVLFLTVLAAFRLFGSRLSSRWKVQEFALSFGGTTTLLIPDDDVARIAHHAWTELVSRKAGIPIEEHDVLVEVYDSWYRLFGELRKLSKEVPVSALHRQADAKTLLGILMNTMNERLRPHLTQHQARFRHWWNATSEGLQPDITPQERQRAYPQYEDLTSDMLEVNRHLVELAECLRQLAHERDTESLPTRIRNRLVQMTQT